MDKAPKYIVLVLGLALVAGLFLWLNGKDTAPKVVGKADEELEISTESGIEDKSPNIDLSLKEETLPKVEVIEETVENIGKEEVVEIPKKPAGGWSGEVLASEISKTVKLLDEGGQVKICYAKPNIPEEYHFSFKVEIFDSTGKTVDRYVSDAGWASDPSLYDPKEKIEEIVMNVSSMENKMAFVVVKVGDKDMAKSANIYQLTINYDGSMTWENAIIE